MKQAIVVRGRFVNSTTIELDEPVFLQGAVEVTIRELDDNEKTSSSGGLTEVEARHLSIDPVIMVGKPVIKGTRIAVEFILELLAERWTHEEIIDSYPGVTAEDVRACLAYASAFLRERYRCTREARHAETNTILSRSCTLIDFLKVLAGADVLWFRDEDPTMVAACLAFPNGTRLIFIQRTYREGVAFVANPTDAETEIGLHGWLWDLWNSDRCHRLGELDV